LLDMNRAGLEMVEAQELSQLAGKSIVDLIYPEDRERFLEMHRAVCDGSPGRLEFRIIGLNGHERLVHSHAVPFETFTGTGEAQTAVLSVTSDITDRKRLEDELRQSQKMEAIGLLAGGIAHDFNNLLTAISGYTEMTLQTLDDDDKRREDLQEVAKASRRAAALTRQLLAVSRRQILQPTVLDVNEMVADIQKLLHRTIPENIDLHLELSEVLDPVRADRGQLEQVVLNLAINAGDAMPQGGRLLVATENIDVDEERARRHPPMSAGRYVRLTMNDTGMGMTAQTQAHIFEPFFTTKERGRGTGLGLATVYGIVKQSEGFIWVESEVGRGTIFEVYLPIVREPIASTVQVALVAEITGGSQTILLAEDDGAVRRLARHVLTNQGYTVIDARDGDEALEFARRYAGAIDLLITDVVMPGLSGRDLAARLSGERPDVRVLYTSGYTENVMKRAGFESEPTLLPKPFLPADLLRKVNEVLRAPT
jgi:two-component system, cell cycle sensor histidine kinase and response regulator CckA